MNGARARGGSPRPSPPPSPRRTTCRGRRSRRAGRSRSLRCRAAASRIRPPQLPSNTSGMASGARSRTSTQRYRARRRASGAPESRRSSSALFAASTSVGEPVAPAQRWERTPGAPPSENTSSPESSATVGRPVRRAKYSALCARIGLERVTGLEQILGALLVQHDVVGKDDLDAGRLEDPPDLPLLPRVPRRRQQLHQPSTCRWAAKSSAIHRPRDRGVGRAGTREKVPCSPVPCTSTNRSGSQHHDVRVHLRVAILEVGQIETLLALHDPDRHGGDQPSERRGDAGPLGQPGAGIRERDARRR